MYVRDINYAIIIKRHKILVCFFKSCEVMHVHVCAWHILCQIAILTYIMPNRFLDIYYVKSLCWHILCQITMLTYIMLNRYVALSKKVKLKLFYHFFKFVEFIKLARKYLHINLHITACVYVWLCVYVSARVFMCACVCVCVCVHVHLHACACVCVHMRAHLKYFCGCSEYLCACTFSIVKVKP